jgi:hypothetical protein
MRGVIDSSQDPRFYDLSGGSSGRLYRSAEALRHPKASCSGANNKLTL